MKTTSVISPACGGGRAVFGEEVEKLKAWLKPLVKPLKNESAVKGIRQLEEWWQSLPAGRQRRRWRPAK